MDKLAKLQEQRDAILIEEALAPFLDQIEHLKDAVRVAEGRAEKAEGLLSEVRAVFLALMAEPPMRAVRVPDSVRVSPEAFCRVSEEPRSGYAEPMEVHDGPAVVSAVSRTPPSERSHMRESVGITEKDAEQVAHAMGGAFTVNQFAEGLGITWRGGDHWLKKLHKRGIVRKVKATPDLRAHVADARGIEPHRLASAKSFWVVDGGAR